MAQLFELRNPHVRQKKKIEWDDKIVPFQLKKTDIRGRFVKLSTLLDDILNQHKYPAQIEPLIVEMILLTALIGQMIKIRWKLSLQMQSNGPVRMIATDYYGPETDEGLSRVRAYASYSKDKLRSEKAIDRIGDGYFAVLLDQGDGTKPYQGITPLSENSLIKSAETYFYQSEQLPTKFHLNYAKISKIGENKQWRGDGIMIQQIPKINSNKLKISDPKKNDAFSLENTTYDCDNWNRIKHQLNTLERNKPIGPSVSSEDWVSNLFYGESPQIFKPQNLKFGCNCSKERVQQSLSIYSVKDIKKMTTKEGLVSADCQFCGANYYLDPSSVGSGKI